MNNRISIKYKLYTLCFIFVNSVAMDQCFQIIWRLQIFNFLKLNCGFLFMYYHYLSRHLLTHVIKSCQQSMKTTQWNISSSFPLSTLPIPCLFSVILIPPNPLTFCPPHNTPKPLTMFSQSHVNPLTILCYLLLPVTTFHSVLTLIPQPLTNICFVYP